MEEWLLQKKIQSAMVDQIPLGACLYSTFNGPAVNISTDMCYYEGNFCIVGVLNLLVGSLYHVKKEVIYLKFYDEVI